MEARRDESGFVSLVGMSRSLARGATAPLHIQIREILEKLISEGSLRCGDRLPSEDEFTREFRVSRMTVRQALSVLASEGLIYRRQGIGTFVGDTKVTRQFMKLSGFSDDVIARGHRPGARTLSIRLMPAPTDAADALDCRPGEAVVLVHRLRTLNDRPAAIQHSYLLASLVPGLENVDEDFPSLYGLLRRQFGLVLNRAEQVIEARRASAAEGRRLEIAARSPVVQVARTTFLDDGRPVELARMLYRADLFQFRMQLWGGPDNK